MQDPLYFALGAPLNVLIATGALSWWILIIFLPVFVVLRIAVDQETFLRTRVTPHRAEVNRWAESMAARRRDVDARQPAMSSRPYPRTSTSLAIRPRMRLTQPLLAELQARRAALDERAAAATTAGTEVIADYKQVLSDLQSLSKEADVTGGQLKSDADKLVADFRAMEPQGILGKRFLLANRRPGKIVPVIAVLVTLVAIVLAPDFPLALIVVFGGVASVGLAYALTHRTTFSLFRILPSTRVYTQATAFCARDQRAPDAASGRGSPAPCPTPRCGEATESRRVCGGHQGRIHGRASCETRTSATRCSGPRRVTRIVLTVSSQKPSQLGPRSRRLRSASYSW